jgi:hypothetical protein
MIFIIKMSRFAKMYSHFIHGRKGSDMFDHEVTNFVNMLFSCLVYYSEMSLVEVAKKNMEKLQHIFFCYK